jgi:hypothetical protein
MNIAPNQVLEIDDNTVLAVDKKGLFGWKNRYVVLAGPLPDGARPAQVTFANSVPSVEIIEGFGYFLGTHPRAKTKRVIATGEGTEMIVQAGNTADRVFLLDSTGVTVVSRAVDPGDETAGQQKRLAEAMTFLEATREEDSPYYVLSDPKPIASDPSAKAFVEYVLEAAEHAGVTP